MENASMQGSRVVVLLAVARWASALVVRTVAATAPPGLAPPTPGSGSGSGSVSGGETAQGGPCAVVSTGRTMLEGWSVPAVGVGMFVLVLISGSLSGLTLALMSMDMTRLRVLAVSGTPSQRRMANTILPVKRYPYFLLCSLLIASVLVNEMLPIMNAKLFGESYKALFISVTLVIVFGEIIPQAVFPRYALELGSAIIWLVYLCMIICCIPAAILSGMLYYALRGWGTAQTMFSAEELITFIALHSEDSNGGPLESRTVALIRDIVQAQDRVLGDVVRHMENVYMVDGNIGLDKEQAQKILSRGFSKIPIYETSKQDSGLPRMRILGYLPSRKLLELEMENVTSFKSVGLAPLPIMDADRPLYDALDLLRPGNARMALIADPTKDTQDNIAGFSYGQYANPRTQVEVGMGSSTVNYLQNDLLWTNHPSALQKEIVGIVTAHDIMEELFGTTLKGKKSRYSGGGFSSLEKSMTTRSSHTGSTGSSTAVLSTASCANPRLPLKGLDVNFFDTGQSKLSLGRTWEEMERSPSADFNDIVAASEDGQETDTEVGRSGTLRRRFSFEGGVDERSVNLLEAGN